MLALSLSAGLVLDAHAQAIHQIYNIDSLDLPDNGYRHNLTHLTGNYYVSSHTVITPDTTPTQLDSAVTLRLYSIINEHITLIGSQVIQNNAQDKTLSLHELSTEPKSTALTRVDDDTIAVSYVVGSTSSTVTTYDVDTGSTTPFGNPKSADFRDGTNGEQTQNHSLVTLDANRLLVAYSYPNSSPTGFMHVITIDPNTGALSAGTPAPITANQGLYPSMVKLDDDTVVLAYRGNSAHPFIQTFDVSADNTITAGTAYDIEDRITAYNSLIRVDDDTVALAYSAIGASTSASVGHGTIKVFDVTSAGVITETDSQTYYGAAADATFEEQVHLNSLALLDSDTIALAYRGDAADGFIRLYDIDHTTGTLTAAGIPFEHDQADGSFNSLVRVDDITLALVYGGDLLAAMPDSTATPNRIKTLTAVDPGTSPPVIVSAVANDATMIVLAASEPPEGTASVQYAVTADTPPTVVISSTTAFDETATNTGTLSYTAEFTEPVTGFDVSDIRVTGTASGGSPMASNFDGTSDRYTFEVKTTSDGTVLLSIPAGAAADAANNGNRASGIYVITVDTAIPEINSIVLTDSSTVVLVASEPLVDVPDTGTFQVSDNTVFGTSLSDRIITLTVNMPIKATGVIKVTYTGSNFADSAGNPLADFTDMSVINSISQVRIVHAALDENSGILEIRFSGTIQSDEVSPEKIHIIDSDSAANSVTLSDGELVGVDGTVVTFRLDEQNRQNVILFDVPTLSFDSVAMSFTDGKEFPQSTDTFRAVPVTSLPLEPFQSADDTIYSIPGVEIGNNGTKMFILELIGSVYFVEYDLATPFDISTASRVQSVYLGSGTDLHISPNGTKLFFAKATDPITTYTLSTPFNISTATLSDSAQFLSDNKYVSGIDMTPDGTMLFIYDDFADLVYQYDLVTPFDVSTAESNGTFLVPGDFTTPITALSVSDDGGHLFLLDVTQGMTRYALATPFDVTTAHSPETILPPVRFNYGIALYDDDTKMILTSDTDRSIHQFALSVYDLETTHAVMDIPVITSVFAAPGIYGIGDTVDITVRYSEDVRVTGIPKMGISIGDQIIQLDYSPAPPSSDLLFQYVVREGDNVNPLDHAGTELILPDDGAFLVSFEHGVETFNALPEPGSAASLATSNVVLDGVRPTPHQYPEISVDTITVQLTEQISLAGSPAFNFAIRGLESNPTVRSVSMSGTNATLTLSGPIMLHQAPTLSYVPSNVGSISDPAGNTLLGFTMPLSHQGSVDLVSLFMDEDNKWIEAKFDSIIDVSTIAPANMRIIPSGSADILLADDALLTVSDSDTIRLQLTDAQINTIRLATRTTLHFDSVAMHDVAGDPFPTPFHVVSPVNAGSVEFPAVGNPTGLAFSNDGRKIFLSDGGSHIISEYSLPVPFVLTQATFVSSLDVDSYAGDNYQVVFSDDGLKMFVSARFGGIVEHSLSAPFTLSTATFVRESAGIISDTTTASEGLTFSGDGSSMLVTTDRDGIVMGQFDLPVQFDLAAFNRGFLLDLSEDITSPVQVIISDDENRVLILDSSNDTVHTYNNQRPDIPFDIQNLIHAGTATLEGTDIDPRTMTFSGDGLDLFVGDVFGDGKVRQYSLATFELYVDPVCAGDQTVVGGVCVDPVCVGDQVLTGGVCVEPTCIGDQVLTGGMCVEPTCIGNQVLTGGMCVDPTCSASSILAAGICRDEVDDYLRLASFDPNSGTFSLTFEIVIDNDTIDPAKFQIREYDTVSGVTLSAAELVTSVDSRELIFTLTDTNRQTVSGYLRPTVFLETSAVTDANGNTFPTSSDISNAVELKILSLDTILGELPVFGDIEFSFDGNTLYIVERYNTIETREMRDQLSQFSLDAPFDVEDPTEMGTTSLEAQNRFLRDIELSNDGTSMFILDDENGIYEYSLSTPFDTSSPTHVRTFAAGASLQTPRGMDFSADGMDLFVIEARSDIVTHYSLTAPFDIRSPTEVSNYSIADRESKPLDVEISEDGREMFVLGSQANSVIQYGMSAPLDLSTVTYRHSLTPHPFDVLSRGIEFSPSGDRMYYLGDALNNLHQYSLNTFDIGVCEGSQTIVDGICMDPTCTGDQTIAGGMCVDPVCAGNQMVLDGVCMDPTCIGDQMTIGGMCVDPVCIGDQSVVEGMCMDPVCPANEHGIGGVCISIEIVLDSVTLNYSTGRMFMIFSDIIDHASITPAKIHIMGTGGDSEDIALSAAELVVSSDSSVVIFDLSDQNRQKVASFVNPAVHFDIHSLSSLDRKMFPVAFELSELSLADSVDIDDPDDPDRSALTLGDATFSNDGSTMFVTQTDDYKLMLAPPCLYHPLYFQTV